MDDTQYSQARSNEGCDDEGHTPSSHFAQQDYTGFIHRELQSCGGELNFHVLQVHTVNIVLPPLKDVNSALRLRIVDPWPLSSTYIIVNDIYRAILRMLHLNSGRRLEAS